jgi:hypothetical protein
MKKLALFAMSLVSISQARAGWDGCYQLVTRGVMYPAICFQGTEEEGIDGTGVRLFVFRTNTNTLDVCALGQVTRMTETEFTFEKNKIKEVVFTNFDGQVANAMIDGFPSNVSAVRLSAESAGRLLENANSEACK